MNSILQPTHNSTPHSARPQRHELGLNIKKQTNEQKTNTGHANVQQTDQGTHQKSHGYTKTVEAIDMNWAKYSDFVKGNDNKDRRKPFGRKA